MSAEGPQSRLALSEGMKNLNVPNVPVGENGKPLVKLLCFAAELIPTVQYGNVTVGPCGAERYIEDLGVEHIKKEFRILQEICEEAVAEDRKTVHALTRQSAGGRYTE